MSALLHPEHKAATILAFRPRGAATQTVSPDRQAYLAVAAESGKSETHNRPVLVLCEICCAIAAPVAFILMLQRFLALAHIL